MLVSFSLVTLRSLWIMTPNTPACGESSISGAYCLNGIVRIGDASCCDGSAVFQSVGQRTGEGGLDEDAAQWAIATQIAGRATLITPRSEPSNISPQAHAKVIRRRKPVRPVGC